MTGPTIHLPNRLHRINVAHRLSANFVLRAWRMKIRIAKKRFGRMGVVLISSLANFQSRQGVHLGRVYDIFGFHKSLLHIGRALSRHTEGS